MQSPTLSALPNGTDYRCLDLSNGDTVIYDPENPDGWIQSAVAFDLTPND